MTDKKYIYHKKVFPFCLGIQYLIDPKNFVLPKLTLNSWKRATQNKKWIVSGFGGLYESFVSLILIEALHQHSPTTQIFWLGPKEYQLLIKFQGIAKITDELLFSDLRKYPVPLFLDQSHQYAFFNYLYNYIYNYRLDFKTRYKNYGKSSRSLIRQIYNNLNLKWNINYLPKFRNLHLDPPDLAKWARIYKFNYHKPFIMIFLDKNFSIHKDNFLNWKESELKTLVNILHAKKIQTLIITSKKIYLPNAYLISNHLDWIFFLLSKAKLVLSEIFDWLGIAQLYSNAFIAHRKVNNKLYLLNRQMRFTKKNSQVLIQNNLSPIDVAALCSI